MADLYDMDDEYIGNELKVHGIMLLPNQSRKRAKVSALQAHYQQCEHTSGCRQILEAANDENDSHNSQNSQESEELEESQDFDTTQLQDSTQVQKALSPATKGKSGRTKKKSEKLQASESNSTLMNDSEEEREEEEQLLKAPRKKKFPKFSWHAYKSKQFYDQANKLSDMLADDALSCGPTKLGELYKKVVAKMQDDYLFNSANGNELKPSKANLVTMLNSIQKALDEKGDGRAKDNTS